MTIKKNLCCRLFSLALILTILGCKDQQPVKGSLAFKQKQAEVYLSYLEQYPDSSGLRLIVANQLDSIGRYRDALRHMDTLIQADSNKYAFWVVKAAIQLDSTDTVSAQQSLARAISLYPGNEALMTQAEIFALQKNDTCLKIAAKMTSGATDKDYIAGLYASRLMDFEKAVPLLEGCLARDPQFAKAYVALAGLWASLGDPGKALQTVQKGLSIAPDQLTLLNLGGEFYEIAGKHDSAQLLYQRSLTIHPYQPSLRRKIHSN